MSESTVFFIRRVSPEDVLRIYKALNVSLPGPVAVKVHSGEPGHQNSVKYKKATRIFCVLISGHP